MLQAGRSPCARVRIPTVLRSLAIALLLSLLSGGVSGPSRSGEQAASRHITLGVLRSDAVLLPFAAFDGDDWSTPWPGAIGGRVAGLSELPVNLAAVPARWWGREVPRQWRLWLKDSKAGLAFNLASPVMTPVGHERRLGLRTDYQVNPQPFVPPFELPYPKEGLAVGGELTVEPIPSVSRQAPIAQAFIERLRPDINAAEERAIGALRSNARWTHPFDRAARAKIVPDLEAWYTSPLVPPGSTVSYIEAVKKYPPQAADDGCGLESFISGWVHRHAREERLKTQLKAVVTYCDREKASYMLPLGQLRVRDRTHWVFQMSGQDHEWYAVAELTPGRSRYVAEYYAGGIPLPLPR